MLCQACNFENPSENRFCIKCGNAFDDNTAKHTHDPNWSSFFDSPESQENEQRTPEDKAERIKHMLCQACNFENPSENRFCIKCGNVFDDNAAKHTHDPNWSSFIDSPESQENEQRTPEDKESHTTYGQTQESLTSQEAQNIFGQNELLEELRNIAFATHLIEEVAIDSDPLAAKLGSRLAQRRRELEQQLFNSLKQELLQVRDSRDTPANPSRIQYFLNAVELESANAPNLYQASKVFMVVQRYGGEVPSLVDEKTVPESSSLVSPPDKKQAHPSSKIDWGDLWMALFSENAMAAVLSFGILLIAISSLVFVVTLWSTFDWWIKQLFFLVQMAAFIGTGHIVKERLKLHISGLALVTIGGIWTLFSTGVAVYEFVGPLGERMIPGIELPIDLPLYGWLIISSVSVPVWAALTYRYKGHLLMQGTIGLFGTSCCLAVASMGANWQWSISLLTVLASIIFVIWKRLVTTSYREVAAPLFWSAHIVAAVPTFAIIVSWSAGGPGYPVSAAIAALAFFSWIALRFTNFLWYQYAAVILPIPALLIYIAEVGVISPAYFDTIIVGLAALYLIGGTRLKIYASSAVLNKWRVLQPYNVVAASLLLLAMFWPEVETWSRSASMLAATVITSTMAYMWKRDPWPWLPLITISVSAIFFVQAIDLHKNSLPLFLVVLGFLGLGTGYILRRNNGFAVPPFSWSVALSAISLWLSFYEYDPSINSHNLPPLIILLTLQSALIYRAPAGALRPILRFIASINISNKLSPYKIHLRHIRVWGSGFLGTIALFLVPFGISAILFRLEIQNSVPDVNTLVAIAWSMAALLISRYLLSKVSPVHELSGWIAGAVAAITALALASDSDSLIFSMTLYYVALLTIAFRIHFRTSLPLYAGVLLLAGAFLETLIYIDTGYLATTIAWSVIAIGTVVIGFWCERFSIKDSVPAYLLAALAITAGEWSAWGSAGAQVLILGSLMVLSTCMAWLVHRELSQGLTWIVSRLIIPVETAAERCKGYVTTGLISITTFAMPIWSIQILYHFYNVNENDDVWNEIGLLLSSLSVLLFIIGGWVGRTQKTYALPLQFAGILTAITGPLMAIESDYYRSASLWISSGGFAACLITFRRWYWIYPTLAAAHLATASSLYISGFDMDIHKKGLLLGIFALLVTGTLGFMLIRLKEPTKFTIRGLDYRIIPIAGLAFADLTASLILAGWDDWSNWEGLLLSIIYMTGSIGAAHLTRSIYIPYASTILLTVSVAFIAGMVGGGLSSRAIGWAVLGLVMWWLGRGVERISKRMGFGWASIWQQPFLNSGIRLSWFAVGFAVITLWLGLTSIVDMSLSVHQATTVTMILALLYLGMTVYHRNPTFGYISAGALVISWYLQIADRDIVHAQFYAAPAGIYLLSLAFFESKRPQKSSLFTAIVNGTGVVALAGSAFVQSLVDTPGWLYSGIIGVEGILLVLWGSATKSKVPFLGGIIAFFVNALYQAISILWSLNAAAAALGIGLTLVILVILLERFRIQLIDSGRRWSQNWSW